MRGGTNRAYVRWVRTAVLLAAPDAKLNSYSGPAPVRANAAPKARHSERPLVATSPPCCRGRLFFASIVIVDADSHVMVMMVVSDAHHVMVVMMVSYPDPHPMMMMVMMVVTDLH
jgi:hypothetical protein